MAIDLTTGIPLDESGIIEQIPLGGQVFPFSDMDATGRPLRNPIYGDDVLPTSALLVGRHPTLVQPQAIYTDSKHALAVREAVFQSNSKPIPPGSTAPVDVNIIGGGGGGGGGGLIPAAYADNIANDTGPLPMLCVGGSSFPQPIGPLGRYLYGYSISMAPSKANVNGWVNARYVICNTDQSHQIVLCALNVYWGADGTTVAAVNQTNMLPVPIDLSLSWPGYDGSVRWYFISNDEIDGVVMFTPLHGGAIL